MSSEREDLQTSKSLYGWTAIIPIIDVRRDFIFQRIKVVTSPRHFDACLHAHNLTKKSRTSTEIGRKVVCATDDIAYQLQGQKVKGQGHQTDKRRDRKSAISSEMEGIYELQT